MSPYQFFIVPVSNVAGDGPAVIACQSNCLPVLLTILFRLSLLVHVICFLNAFVPIEVTVLGITTVPSRLHNSNALLPIFVTPSGIVTPFIYE